MARAATPQIISDIQNPDSTASRIEALRLLKNEIIGHDQRKEAWIGWGIIPLLSQILAGRRGAGKKTTGGEVNGHTRRQHLARSRSGRSDDDEVCLQAILIIGSLAQGTLFLVQLAVSFFCCSPLREKYIIAVKVQFSSNNL